MIGKNSGAMFRCSEKEINHSMGQGVELFWTSGSQNGYGSWYAFVTLL
jgi:hypothetical protein